MEFLNKKEEKKIWNKQKEKLRRLKICWILQVKFTIDQKENGLSTLTKKDK